MSDPTERDRAWKRPLRWARAALPQWGLLVAAAAVAVALAFVTASLIGDGEGSEQGDDEAAPGLATIDPTRSSWIEGQASLASYSAYGPISDRALALARALVEGRADLLAAIERARLRAERRAERAEIRAARRAQRRAERAYERALARAERLRERLERRRERQQRRLERKLERLREKNKIEPGEECSLPEVQELFDCSTGYPF